MSSVIEILHLSSCESTMDEGFKWLSSRPEESTSLGVVLADEQTQGRGTRHRGWHSLKGNLFVSFCFHLPKEREGFSQISLVAAVALGQAIEAHYPDLSFFYKWPNDVMVDGKKVAGILTETREMPLTRWVVVGMGVNLKRAPVLEQKPYLAGVLGEGQEKSVTPLAFLHSLAPLFDRYKNLWLKEGLLDIAPEWQNRALHKGEAIRLMTAQGLKDGIFQGINSQGFLRLQLSSGEEIVLSAGEIEGSLNMKDVN